MRRATIATIALPNGFSPMGAPRLSLFLAPRLESDEGERLDLFPPLLDWPAALDQPGVGYVVEFAEHGAVSTRVVSASPSSALWTALFRPALRVTRRTPATMAERAFVTYPYAAVGEHLEQRYADIAADHITRLPPREVVVDGLVDLTDVALRGSAGRETVDQHVRRLLRQAEERAARRRVRGDVPGGEPPIVVGDELPEGPSRDLAQFEAFHHPLDEVGTEPPAGADHEQAGRQIDFHGALAALGDHPGLLRALGLVIDLELDAAPPAAPDEAPGRLRAFPLWIGHGPDVEVQTPWLAYVADPDAKSFHAANRPGRDPGEAHVDGLVAIGQGGWDVVQLDVDGAAFKAIGAAAAAAARDGRSGRPRAAGDTGQEGLPALRSGGLTLAHRSSAGFLHRSLADQRRVAAADPDDVDTALFAGDVARGYRLDLLEHRSGRWRSLHARRVTFTVTDGPPIAPVHDEGLVRRGVRQPRRMSPETAPTYVHDALCRWDGWSLAAPHPGKSLSKDGRAPDPSHPETLPQRVENTPPPGGIPLSIAVEVEPGTLPRLRFGERYHVRLRTVDLAGNGPTVEDADAAVAADAEGRLVLPTDAEGVRLLRFEPVGSPELVARAPVGEGESLAHLVIRSDLGVAAADWAAVHGTAATCERHVVPPKTSQLQAERHGMFDAAIGTGAGAAAAYTVARRESGRLTDAETRAPDGTSRRRRARLHETDAGQYVIDDSPLLVAPYLPDPLGAAVAVVDAPGAKAGVLLRMDGQGTAAEPAPPPLGSGETAEPLLQVSFGAQDRWPDVLPFRLVLAEGEGPPQWDPAERELVLRLPKAGRARIALSCAPPPDRLDELAPRAWARRRHPDDAHAAIAAAGRAWQISPARPLELVHAVQRPLRPPVISSLQPVRSAGATSVLLTGRIAVHGASSERLDLTAEWEDTVDDGVREPGPVTGTAHVFEHPIHVRYDLQADATPPRGAISYDEDAGSVTLRTPAPGEGPGPTPRHELGDTRHRVVRYRAVATSRFREYFPRELAQDPANVTSRSDPFELDIPSTARPDAPRIVQVLPTFSWERDRPSGLGVVNIRHGGGLRIYLERPWYTSGAGELLGLVLWPGTASVPAAAVERFVTRWGRDPIWPSPAPPGLPALEHFTRAVDSAPALPLVELGEQASAFPIAVAGHAVGWDGDRGLWFCDVGLRTGLAHTPFVRLALARWQPHSLPGLELSPVVLADFAQPAPDRALTILRHLETTFTGDPDEPPQPTPLEVRLSVTGVGPPTRVDVTVQRRIAGSRDDVGWVDATDPSIVIHPTRPPAGSDVRWAGSVRFEDPNAAPFRILLRESEVFPDGRARVLFIETVEVP